MRGLFVPLRLATDARQLELVTDLDPCIDKVRLSHLPSLRDFSPPSLQEHGVYLRNLGCTGCGACSTRPRS
jgi:osomolarity two-component system sensor histidine kinase SLN1